MTSTPEFARLWRIKKLIINANERMLFTPTKKREAVRKLILTFPNARRIRFAGRCDQKNCRCTEYLTFQLAGFDSKGNRGDEESCGYFCPNCKWSNAGSRMVKHPNMKRVAMDYLEGLKKRTHKGGMGFFHEDKEP